MPGVYANIGGDGMTTIQEISTAELQEDLRQTLGDMELCMIANRLGLTTYGQRLSIPDRLNANRKIAAKIMDELKRRGVTE